jgi:hypothetical protein
MAFNIKYVYDLVDDISPKLTKINQNINKATQTVKQSAAKMGSSFDNMKRKLDAVGSKARDAGKSLFLKLTVPVGLMGGVAIKAASDFEESMNKVDVAFGSASKGVKDFATTAGKDFGIDRGTALDMAAMFGDMSTSMGLSQDMAGTLSQRLVGLSGDLASFKNINVEQATTALAGVFTGETESLKRLGVVMTQTNLEQFAQEKGIQKSIKAMTQAEKVLLRYQFVMSKTKNAQGDFLRTNEGFANQMRILSSNINELKISFGLILLPIATKIVNVVSKLAIKFNELSPTTKKIIAVVAVLAAGLAPVLIAIGLMIPAITALIPVIGALGTALLFLAANPIGIVIAALAGFIVFSKSFRDDFITVFGFISDAFVSFWDSLKDPIMSFITFFTDKIGFIIDGFRSLGKIGAKIFGADMDVSQQLQGGLDQTTNINQNQNSNLQGRLDVNFNNIPKGSSVNTNMGGNTDVNLGTNLVFAGG